MVCSLRNKWTDHNAVALCLTTKSFQNLESFRHLFLILLCSLRNKWTDHDAVALRLATKYFPDPRGFQTLVPYTVHISYNHPDPIAHHHPHHHRKQFFSEWAAHRGGRFYYPSVHSILICVNGSEVLLLWHDCVGTAFMSDQIGCHKHWQTNDTAGIDNLKGKKK